MDKVVFHVDVNSAFLSWESVRRVAEGGDDLRLVPSVIGGNPDRRTSIVLAKSIPAKKYGIVTGEPMSMAFRKCPRLIAADADFALYSKMSVAFKDICRDFSPVVEEFSIDECFLDMTSMKRLYPDPIAAAYGLKNRIRSELGFTVNVGISRNKLLAKMASDFEKPDKVHTLFPGEIADKMWPLPVNELFLCGRASADRLRKVNINTIGDLARCDAKSVQALLGNRPGLQLWEFANGISSSPVDGGGHIAKGYSNEITFEDDIVTWEAGENVLLHLADSVGSRVRNDNVRGFCISVTIRGGDMKKKSHQKKLDHPTDSTTEIYSISKQLMRDLWDGRLPLRLIGLSLSEMGEEQEQQLSLFDKQENSGEKDRSADRAVDELRRRFGDDIIMRAGMIDSGVKIRKKK